MKYRKKFNGEKSEVVFWIYIKDRIIQIKKKIF